MRLRSRAVTVAGLLLGFALFAVSPARAQVPAKVIISAVEARGSTAAQEWLELQNVGCLPFDLDGCRLMVSQGTGCNLSRVVLELDSDDSCVPGGVVDECVQCANSSCLIAADGSYFLIASEDWISGGAGRTGDAVFATADVLRDNSAVQLFCGSSLDLLGWGTVAAGCYETSPAAGLAGANTVNIRKPAPPPNACSTDSDNNSLDFALVTGPSNMPRRRTTGPAGCVACSARVDLLDFTAERSAEGVRLAWLTGSEVDCGAFALLRCDLGQSRCAAADHAEVSGIVVPCENDPAGWAYDAMDATASTDTGYSYYLREHETTGGTRDYGPALVGPLVTDDAASGTIPTASRPGATAAGDDVRASGCSVGRRLAGGGPLLLLLGLLVALRRQGWR
jgi:hypothetical protein